MDALSDTGAGGPGVAAAGRLLLGIEQIRPEQEDAIRSVLAGRDTLCVMPTGSGKSAIYQIAGALLPGATVVVSPLLALQRDQVEGLAELGAGPAAAVSSAVGVAERERALSRLRAGGLEFVFLAPEQLAKEDVLARVSAADVSLLVVDEAHCVSQWGHDFRPDYLLLGAIAERLGRPAVLALTATASPRVRADIATQLRMRDPRVCVSGFDRPNIWLGSTTGASEKQKLDELVARVTAAEKPGIVYVGTRRQTATVRNALEAAGQNVFAYHAGMRRTDREAAHGAFMKGSDVVLVATNAFGMGIDKPDVRFVFHYHASDSLDSYYQEIGRAGRDGAVAQALLFYRRQDLALHRFFAGASRVSAHDVESVVAALARHDGPVGRRRLAQEADVAEGKVARIASALGDLGWASLSPTGRITRVADGGEPRDLAEVLTAFERREEDERTRLEFLREYAETSSCRRAFVLRYFGEPAEERCGFCDSCDTGRADRVAARLAGERATQPDAATPPTSADPAPPRPLALPIGSWVQHRRFGLGVVTDRRGDVVAVRFESAGTRTMRLGRSLARGVLTKLRDGG